MALVVIGPRASYCLAPPVAVGFTVERNLPTFGHIELMADVMLFVPPTMLFGTLNPADAP